MREILTAEKREHRGRRGRTWYTYHLQLADTREPASIEVPGWLSVDRSVWAAAARGRLLELRIGQGWLGHPWYRELRVLPSRTGPR